MAPPAAPIIQNPYPIKRSKEDHVQQISTSIFITNFPEQFSFRDLWKVCQDYGRVIDAYIPNRRSKTGSRFGFVRFIHIKDVDRLVRNLCTIWVGRLRLHANVARFQRSPLNNSKYKNHINAEQKSFVGESSKVNESGVRHNSYAGAVKQKAMNHGVEVDNKPSLVLDDSCILQCDFSLSLMGKVLDFGSLSNMNIILAKEGFDKLTLKYMGGFWVLIEFFSKPVLEKFKPHVGVGSWFSSLQYASNSFMIDERVAWVDIEGVPLKVWTKNTFTKISSKWGEFLFEEDKENLCLNSKRVCIKTKLENNIFESVKIIVHGKIHWIRAKEVSDWVPDFMEDEEGKDESDEETEDADSVKENSNLNKRINPEGDSDSEEVPETIFGDDHVTPKKGDAKKDGAEHGTNNVTEASDATLKYPPGFTPVVDADTKSDDVDNLLREENASNQKVFEEKSIPEVKNRRSMSPSKEEDKESGCSEMLIRSF
ncbi:hypothetical protein CTI12_AA518330 [Artemisia annua]|uniref:RRM domain-containing protein n=1 Tax=Artemisia annua TaxID=35608 RepID=A0A2U1L8S8_ARTAN|nr:hypothetical protein CTI12_AA518330 [Artemisia annua]